MDEYLSNTLGQVSPVQTITMPTAASGSNAALTLVGTGVEGFLQLSTNGQYLVMAGYGVAPGTATPQSSAASVINRVIGRVDINSLAIDTTTALTDSHGTSNIRSATSTNGTDLWTGGGGTSPAGVCYAPLGSTTGTRVNTSGNSGTTRRVAKIFNGQLYVSGASTGGPNLSINSVGTGTPTSGSAETNLPGMPTSGTHSTYDFWFQNTTTVYLADDGNAASGGGIQKWTFDGTNWVLQYTLLNNGATNTAVRGLTGYTDSSGNAILFATTSVASANALITVTDTGAASTASTLATAPANTAFRGVQFIPNVPEPGTAMLLVVGVVGLAANRRRR